MGFTIFSLSVQGGDGELSVCRKDVVHNSTEGSEIQQDGKQAPNLKESGVFSHLGWNECPSPAMHVILVLQKFNL